MSVWEIRHRDGKFWIERTIKNPQEYDSDWATISIPEALNEKETKDPRCQARFERSRQNNVSNFRINPDY